MRLTLSFFICLLLISCGRVGYMPHVPANPLPEKSGDASLIATLSNDKELKGSYAFTDQLFVTGHWGNAVYDSADTEDLPVRFNSVELAAGYYGHFNENGIFSISAGAGFGSTTGWFRYRFLPDRFRQTTAHYRNYFIQTTNGFRSDWADRGGTLRFNYVEYYRYDNTGQTTYRHLSRWFFEPSVFWRIGWKFVRLEIDFGWSIPINKTDLRNYDGFLLGLGLALQLNVF